MGFKIGFMAEQPSVKAEDTVCTTPQKKTVPKKSVVMVHFAAEQQTLAYYNDMFDLQCGDMVYVDGKMAGKLGRVVEISYNFKISLRDYKRVIDLVDTQVHGQFFMARSYFITFDPCGLPANRAQSWFMPSWPDQEFCTGQDGSSFYLNNLNSLKIGRKIGNAAFDYYMENRVKYLCIDGDRGIALVIGSSPYKVEFTYKNGQISNLVCSCYCVGYCKHQVAAMMLLNHILAYVQDNLDNRFEKTGYMAVVDKALLFERAIAKKKGGSISF